MNKQYSLQSDGFWISAYNQSRPFSSFLPGIAGEAGKPMWVFYANRGQCLASFGIRNKNNAMLEFLPANKAYSQTPITGFRTFLKIAGRGGSTLYEPFQTEPIKGVEQRLRIRPEEIEIEETNAALGLRIRVAYFTLPNESLPVLVRQVTIENTGRKPFSAELLDGLPQIVPFGLIDVLLKQMSRTMEAFAEIRHVERDLPFFKLKIEPSDKPDVEWINGGFFAFSLKRGKSLPIVVDPDLVFGSDTSFQNPLAFLNKKIKPLDARRESLTGCAFSQQTMSLKPKASIQFESYFGQADDWEIVREFRARIAKDSDYAVSKRAENSDLITALTSQFALHAGPVELDPYSRQAFLDNTLRGGQPVVIDSPNGPRIFHTFTRKHGDMERDYNFFEVAPTYYSQGNGNFRDVNQNRRSENFLFAGVGASNIETFFNLIQLDGNNPLVISYEKFHVPQGRLSGLWKDFPEGRTPAWEKFFTKPFSPGHLLEELIDVCGSPEKARPWFEKILGLSEKIQDAAHGEGYWVDHWIYNLDLLDSYAAIYPDQLKALLLDRHDFTYFDNDHIVQPRAKKYVLRKDGAVRQMHAVVKDVEKAKLIAQRKVDPNKVRTKLGQGEIYRTTLLAKLLNLIAVKASTLDPFGIGLEMESEKPGWCDALNGMPGLLGSSTHEAYALKRAVEFTLQFVESHLPASGSIRLSSEVSAFLHSLTSILTHANASNFFETWQQLATRREAYRAEIRLGLTGEDVEVSRTDLVQFLNAVHVVLSHGLAKSVDAKGLSISYYINDVAEYDVITETDDTPGASSESSVTHVDARAFRQTAISAFLEGAVQSMRSMNLSQAGALYQAVRQSSLYDKKLGMYRLNVPLEKESFEIGRNKIFSPGWLENESIFLHMHYKFLLETLRSGLVKEFFQDLERGLVAFQKPEVYGRSPLENSSFIASSRFPDAKVHGTGFVARLSGATAEWISMVLHMGLGASPFRVVDGQLRFEPKPSLVDWLFTKKPLNGISRDTYGFTLFGHTWILYVNPKRRATFGPQAVSPTSYELVYTTGITRTHVGAWLSADLAADLRDGKLTRLSIILG